MNIFPVLSLFHIHHYRKNLIMRSEIGCEWKNRYIWKQKRGKRNIKCQIKLSWILQVSCCFRFKSCSLGEGKTILSFLLVEIFWWPLLLHGWFFFHRNIMSNGVKASNARHNLGVNVDEKGGSHTNTMTHTWTLRAVMFRWKKTKKNKNQKQRKKKQEKKWQIIALSTEEAQEMM